MLCLHVHWQPPLSPTDLGGILFWAETSAAPPPPWQRGRLAQNPKPRPHPFCASPQVLEQALVSIGEERSVTLHLPSTRTGPRPAPGLIHSWELDHDTQPFLAPRIVTGLWSPSADAWKLLLELPGLADYGGDSPPPFTLGDDARFWSHVAALVLETLAAQKIVPVLAPAGPEGKTFHARWLPVLDGPTDGPRLARLEAVMPPICRVALPSPSPGNRARGLASQECGGETPRGLLTTFLNTTCDALARRCGRRAASYFARGESEPVQRWLEALFAEDPTVEASLAQLQALAASQRAWMRNLHLAGDAVFRIGFRLEAPAQDQKPAWQLHYLLQARDDPSLFIPAETVWKESGSVLTKLGRRSEQPQEKLLAGLGYAARLFPPIAGSLKGKRPTQLALDTATAYLFLRETAPLLDGAGFGLLVPPWWNKPGARLGASA